MTPPATTLLVVALAGASGCSRVQDDARDAASDVRGAASRVGDRLADSWLTARVQARYFADDTVKGRDIDVTSRDGVVTLRGSVASELERARARELAEAADGVARVDDQLRIGQAPLRAGTERDAAAPTTGAVDVTFPQTPGTPAAALDDATITSLIQARYFLHGDVKARQIDVDTRNGVVTLRGRVGSDDERAAALLMARTTDGVQRVEDGLTVDVSLAPAGRADGAVGTTGARQDDASLESSVEERLGDVVPGLEVSARDGIVLLQGEVSNPGLRARAVNAAREVDGVVQVVDRLEIRQPARR